MTETTVTRHENGAADVTLGEGCPLCGGELALRMTPGAQAASCCKQCRWISRPQVTMGPTGLQVAYPTSALA